MVTMVVKLGSVVALAGLVASGTSTPAEAGTIPDGGPYAVLALERADVKRGALVGGGVAALERQVRLDRNVSVAGTVAAPHIVLRPRAIVGALRCNVITGGTSTCQPMPTIDPSIFVRPDAQAGSDNVKVPKKSRHSALAAGAYGKLTIGREGQMLLAGGDYTFQSIRIGTRASFQCLEACTVAVRRGLKVGRAAVVLGADFRVAGRNGSGVRLATKANVDATIYAPTVHVRVGNEVNARGNVVGRRVTVGTRSFIGTVDPSATAE